MQIIETSESTSTRRFSRRTLLKGAGATGIGLVALPALDLATASGIQSASAQSESLNQIINIAATAEALAVTLLGGVIDSANRNNYSPAIPPTVLNILVAAQAEEEFHYEYLTRAGAKPLTTTFHVPDTALLTDSALLFNTVVKLETAFIAAYVAAAGEFTDLNRPDLVKVAFQIAGTEAEHRVLANNAAGQHPADDVAFEAKLFTSVGQAANALENLGFIGGSGPAVTYPGPVSIHAAGVSERRPGGLEVFCLTPGENPLKALLQFIRAFRSGEFNFGGH